MWWYKNIHLWELDHKEGWTQKNWCFLTVVLKKTLESPLDSKEIKPVNPKGNQSWIFIGRTDAEAEVPILWPHDAKSWLIRKDTDAGQDGRQEEKGMTEDKMVGWHHRLNGHECEQAPGEGEGPGSLACCSSWGRTELDTTDQLSKQHTIPLLCILWSILLLYNLFSHSVVSDSLWPPGLQHTRLPCPSLSP